MVTSLDSLSDGIERSFVDRAPYTLRAASVQRPAMEKHGVGLKEPGEVLAERQARRDCAHRT